MKIKGGVNLRKPLRVGVIGTGFIGKQHVEAIRRIPNLEVLSVADSNEDRAKEIAAQLGVPKAYGDYHAMINDPEIDVIHNCTPSAFHFSINKEAILKHKHIYCEKPLALDSKESGALVKMAEKGHIAVGVNFNYRHNAMVQEMRRRVLDDKIGRILLVTGNYLQDWLLYDTDYDWRLDASMGGKSRAVADIGSHLFDTSEFIMDKKITSVYARLFIAHDERKLVDKATGQCLKTVPVNSEDAAFILGKFEDGTPFSFVLSQVSAGYKNALSIALSGSGALLEWHQEKPDHLKVGHRDVPNEDMYADAKFLSDEVKHYAALPGGHALGWHDAFTNGIRAYYESIFNDTFGNEIQPYATFKTGHEIMQLTEACLESNETQQWITL